MKRTTTWATALGVMAGLGLLGACGGPSNPNGYFNDGTSSGSSGTSGSSGSSGTSGSSGDFGSSGSSGSLGDGGSSGSSNLLDSGCATATAATSRAPVYMLMILDGSGSMKQNNKWASLVPALDSIFDSLLQQNDPSFAVGLIAFSDQNDPTCGGGFPFGGGCQGPYPSNVDVPIASVDQAHHDKLRGRIDPSSPQGDTPTHAALQGGYSELDGYTPSGKTPPNGKKVLVLMTDGVPTDGSDVNTNSQLVASELAKGTSTFAIGVGPFPSSNTQDYDPVFMGHLAKAGGNAPASCNQDETQNVQNVCHFQITPGNKTAAQLEQEFINAINQIRGAVATCEYVLDKSGGSVDPSQVNVIYTDGSGQQHVLVQDPTNGWTYDDPNNPSKVLLHGQDCNEVKSDPSGKISIVLGCKTIAK